MSQSELSFSGIGRYFRIPVLLDFTVKTTFVYHKEIYVTVPLPV